MSLSAENELEGLSANGKAIIFGEHAVIFGRPALAVGLPSAMRVLELRPDEGSIRLRVRPWNLVADEARGDPLGEMLRLLGRLVDAGSRSGMQVVLETELPAGGGLGSSAALSVALVRCLLRVRGLSALADRVREMAHELEKIFHGHPSGLDDTVACYGGLCLFQARGLDSVPPGAQRLDGRTARLSGEIAGLVVGLTGIKSATRQMVSLVVELRKKDQKRVEAIFDGIAGCLAEGLQALTKCRLDLLGAAMSENHRLLARLGLSCPQTEAMIEAALEAGALGAKLTGAGGGGAVVALAPGREEEVLSSWRRMGFDGFSVSRVGSLTGGCEWSAVPRRWPAPT